MKLQAFLLKKRLWHTCSPVNFCEISKNTFFHRTPPVVASYKSFLSIYRIFTRRNFSLVARYSLKFTRCSLLVVKSLVIRCKIRSLLLQKLLVAKIYSLLVAEVARCNNRLLLVAKFARYALKKLLVAKIHWLIVTEVARCKKIAR